MTAILGNLPCASAPGEAPEVGVLAGRGAKEWPHTAFAPLDSCRQTPGALLAGRRLSWDRIPHLMQECVWLCYI